MRKFDNDHTNGHRVTDKSFGVKECWSDNTFPSTFDSNSNMVTNNTTVYKVC